MLSYEGEKRRNKSDLAFPEDEVKLAKTMMAELKTTMEFFHYIMNHRGESSLAMILLSSDDVKLDQLLPQWKRQSDVLFELDKANNVYVIICQSTDSQGGKEFAEILMANIRLHGESDTYCIVSEPRTMRSSIQEVIFDMVEKYMIIKEEQKANQVFFTGVENTISSEDAGIIYHTDRS
ncbi:MAG: hypothetical protein U9R13_05905 [Campylobacterota bacterium]|nr:hypothetical protein [Campylobacterota bacterium]